MNNPTRSKSSAEKVAAIVAAAGGRLVGRTRLQKLAYLLEQVGLGDGFQFQYRHYGPYSEELALATRDATLMGVLEEAENAATWGGTYSIYTTSQPAPDATRLAFAQIAADANAVELELAATAAFLSQEGDSNPWEETARRKPDKADAGRLQKAKELYRKFAGVRTPTPLPAIV
jgi:uncharacterized protein YwgA